MREVKSKTWGPDTHERVWWLGENGQLLSEGGSSIVCVYSYKTPGSLLLPSFMPKVRASCIPRVVFAEMSGHCLATA